MTQLAERIGASTDFLIGVELVSTRGMLHGPQTAKTLALAQELATAPRIDWVSITDNAGGNPMLAASALGKPLRDAGREVIIHLSCKDFNRNGLESEAWRLASEGFHNILVLTGDYPGHGVGGGGKPAFDIDSIGLLTLLGQMNAGLDATRAGAKKTVRLDRTQFFPGAVVTNFKLLENEVIPQLLKMERKLAAGARFLINQIGYDSRKVHELIAWMRRRGHGSVPLIGNVYVLNPGVARVFRAQKIPGVVIAEKLAEICEAQRAAPDKGKAFFLELAAKQIAIYRGLGYRGAYLGGVHTAAEIERVLELERGFAADDWKQFAREIQYSRPGEFFVFDRDEATGLANPEKLEPTYAASLGTRPKTHNVTLNYRVSKIFHDLMFTSGKALWNTGAALCSRAKDPMQGPAWLRAIEHTSKRVMFDCRDCGDCSLSEIAFLCPESACAKNQRNGPCGGTRDGKCEVYDYECIWSRAYERLKSDGREDQMLAHTPAVQDQGLRYTSSWANTWAGRDHLAKHPPTATPPIKP